MKPTNLHHSAILCTLVICTYSTLVWSASDEELARTALQALEQGDSQTAQRALERLRYNGAITAEQRIELARLYQRQGRRDAARAELNQIRAADADSEVLLLQAGLAASDNAWALVRDLSRQLIKREPDHAEAYLRLGQALQELGDEAAADEAYARYARLTAPAQQP